MSDKRRIEGDMTCDAGFLVLPECLDQSFESRTACFPLTVRLPRLDQSQHTYNLLRRSLSSAPNGTPKTQQKLVTPATVSGAACRAGATRITGRIPRYRRRQ